MLSSSAPVIFCIDNSKQQKLSQFPNRKSQGWTDLFIYLVVNIGSTGFFLTDKIKDFTL